MRDQFSQLTGFLQEHESLWRERPFTREHLSWESILPSLRGSLLDLDEDQVTKAEHHPLRVGELVPQLRAIGARAHELSLVPTVTPTVKAQQQAILKSVIEVRGRKRLQILSFIEAIRQLEIPIDGTWTEWCSGKGHLGRGLMDNGAHQILSLERQENLISKGRELTAKLGYNQEFIQADVLSPPLPCEIQNSQGIVALHACGTLTDTVLRTALEHRIPYAVAAPCCYHAGVGKQRSHWSKDALAGTLHLSGEDLRLVTAEVVVARPSIQRARLIQMAWRLALDQWVREVGGGDNYTKQGPFPGKLFSQGFEDFMKVACKRFDAPMPTRGRMTELLNQGEQRGKRVRALGLVRSLFRRPLETWTNLDRAIGIEEEGHEVSVKTFCPRNASPRNQLIVVRTH